jgi:hypothetical protein
MASITVHGILKSLQAIAVIYLHLGHDDCIPKSFQLICDSTI